MATKKAQSKAPAASSSMDSMSMWKWLYVLGSVVAGLVSALHFMTLDPYLGWVLLAIGLLVGFLYFDSADLMNFGIRYVILFVLVQGAGTFLGGLGMVTDFVANFLKGYFNFLGPVVLAMAIMYFWKKYLGNMM